MAARNKALAEKYMAALAAGAPPEEVAALFAEDVDFNIPGDPDAFPWIGHNHGRAHVLQMQRDLPVMADRQWFRLDEILASDQRAVVCAALGSKCVATGVAFDTPINIQLKFNDKGEIQTFLLLEDGYVISEAAKKK